LIAVNETRDEGIAMMTTAVGIALGAKLTLTHLPTTMRRSLGRQMLKS
jgi:hypothetical protein